MNLNYQQYIPSDFAPDSRVWIYQSNRLLTIDECMKVEPLLQDFVREWNTHSTPVKGYASILFGQFIVLMADETVQYVSGCSTDSSVRLIKKVEEFVGANFFDRQLLAFVVKDAVDRIPLAQFGYAAENGFITPDTLYFNNLVTTKQDFLAKWIIPVKDSWLKSRLPTTVK